MPVATLAAGGLALYGAGYMTGSYMNPPDQKRKKGSAEPFKFSLSQMGQMARQMSPTLFHTPGAALTGRDDAVVVVDPFSTGARLALEAQQRGFKIIRVLSTILDEEFLDTVLPEDCKYMAFDATITFDPKKPELTVQEILEQPYHVVSVVIGCETGVEAYDAITERMPGVVSNGTKSSAARRDKYIMGEQVRSAGIRAVKQQECSQWDGEADQFVTALGVKENDTNGAWCVLKPTRSAGTDGVYICKSFEEAKENWSKILGLNNIFGDLNQTVLVQEFLRGKEYVVDSVSVEGEHKCVAIWEYDKRPCNGHQFVYFGMRLFQSADGKKEEAMVKYVHSVLDALEVKHGPSHGEVIWLDSEDAPCLVEVGCRPHGGEGTFIEMVTPTLGYSQVSVMVEVLEKPYRFKRLPKRPERFTSGAMEVCLVSRQEGTLAAYPMLDQVKRLRSFKSMEIKTQVGGKLENTINFVTTPGSIMLVHEDRNVVEEDQATIHRWEEEGKFYTLAGAQGSKFTMRNL